MSNVWYEFQYTDKDNDYIANWHCYYTFPESELQHNQYYSLPFNNRDSNKKWRIVKIEVIAPIEEAE